MVVGCDKRCKALGNIKVVDDKGGIGAILTGKLLSAAVINGQEANTKRFYIRVREE